MYLLCHIWLSTRLEGVCLLNSTVDISWRLWLLSATLEMSYVDSYNQIKQICCSQEWMKVCLNEWMFIQHMLTVMSRINYSTVDIMLTVVTKYNSLLLKYVDTWVMTRFNHSIVDNCWQLWQINVSTVDICWHKNILLYHCWHMLTVMTRAVTQRSSVCMCLTYKKMTLASTNVWLKTHWARLKLSFNSTVRGRLSGCRLSYCLIHRHLTIVVVLVTENYIHMWPAATNVV